MSCILFPSCIQRCSTVFLVLSTRTLSGFDLALIGGTVSLHSASDAGRISQSLVKGQRPVLLEEPQLPPALEGTRKFMLLCSRFSCFNVELESRYGKDFVFKLFGLKYWI